MAADLSPRCPGAAMPEEARDAAVRAGRRRRPLDPRVLQRVRDALVRLPASAVHRHYIEVPGDSLASPDRPALVPAEHLASRSSRRGES